MSRVRLEPTTSVFDQAKTVHALDRAASVLCYLLSKRKYNLEHLF
jgi:hypothetical protein